MKVMKCKVCGKVVIVQNDTPSGMVCCGENMVELVPGETDGAVEKHVPAVSVNGNKVHAEVGSVEHPMLENHYIMFILLETEKGYQVRNLVPGEKPVADFTVEDGDKAVAVYEYCNLHGFWKVEV